MITWNPKSLWAQTETPGSLSEILVTDRAPVPVELQSSSATVVSHEQIVNNVYVTPTDILRKSPGVAITQYGESGVPPLVKMRGFDGAHTYGIAFYLDGININQPDGSADNSVFNPIEIDYVEIIKGPTSVLYGNYASGGTVHYHTINRANTARFNVRYGSFNTFDTSGILARTGELIDQVYSFQVYHTDGYRNHSDWDKYNLAARFTLHPNSDLAVTLGLRTFTSKWESAGYIANNLPPKTAVTDGVDDGNGGERYFRAVNLNADYSFNSTSSLNFKAWYSEKLDERYSVGNPTGWSMIAPMKSWLVGGSYKFDGELGGRKFIFTAGTEFKKESEKYHQYGLTFGTGRMGQIAADYDFDINTASVYGDINFQILEPLLVRAGIRYDKLTGSLHYSGRDPNQPNTKFNSKGYSAVSPKFGLLYTPFDNVQIFANYSRGFQAPSAQTAFYEDPSEKMSYRDQYEVGFRAQPLDWIETGITHYWLYTENDLTWDPTEMRSKNIGKTLRTGVETFADFRPWASWLIHLDYTYQTAKWKEANMGGIDVSGRRLEEVPRHITNIEVAYNPPQGLGGRINFNWNADFMVRDYGYIAPVERVKNPVGQDYGRLDVQLNYKFNEKFQLVLDVLNILDKDYIAYQSPARNSVPTFTYSPLNPLTVYLGLNINLD
jgi:iron complex outermembrane receptor protein